MVPRSHQPSAPPPATVEPWQDPSTRIVRASTAAGHAQAVTTAITLMRDQLDAPHRLRDVARTALMSPFHFHRVFRLTTTTTPGRFLAALRMSEAKRMLIETPLSATEISVRVGYSSFGTFTTQFTKLVGMSPGRYRRCAEPIIGSRLTDLLAGATDAAAGGGTAAGWVSARPDGSPGIAVVALYSSELAATLPLACSAVPAPGPVRLRTPESTGTFTVLAASVGLDARLGAFLAGHPGSGTYLGATRIAVPSVAGNPTGSFVVRLRPAKVTDPPVLTAFPLLFSRYHDTAAVAVSREADGAA